MDENAQSEQEISEDESTSKKDILISDDSDTEVKIVQDRSKKISMFKKNRAIIESSDSECEENENLKEKLSKDLFAESSNDNAKPLETSFEPNYEHKKIDKSEKRVGPGRKSKQTALEEIRSETQRLIRESKISLPYHRPKQRSLSDFLNRRKSVPGIPLHSTSMEITKVWKQIEEMEREAESFYMSESDNESVSNDYPDHQNKEDKDEYDRTISSLVNSTETEQNADSGECKHAHKANNHSGLTQSDNLSELDFHLTMTEEFKKSDGQSEEIEMNQLEMASEQDEKVSKVSNKSIIQDENEKMFLSATLNKIPKLNGAPDEMIDLDVTKPKPGALGLLKRFIKHASIKTKKTVKDDVTLNIVSSEIDDKGEIINIKEETVKVKSGESAKPGESLVKLKATLQQKIALSREEQLAKKHEEFKLYEEEIYEDEKDACDKLLDEDEEEFEIEDSEGSSSSDKEDEEDNEKEKLFADSLAEESDNEVDDECSQVGENSQDTALVRDEESIQSSESVPTQINFTEEIIKVPPLKELMYEDSIDDNLLALCSGKFFTQPVSLTDLEKADKLNCPISEQVASSSNELIKDTNNITSDEDEDGFGIPKSKKCKKLVFSDDDEDNINHDENEKDDYNTDNSTEEVENDIFNEIEDEEVEDEEIELARKISKGYLDGEAELSESDWDSADEDERGLDKFEIEEGDADKINEQKLQKELGKIHMRELMAEDKREIHLLQELLLEDGELHSDGPRRKKLFRWANQDDDTVKHNITLDDDNELEENENLDDEEAWRKERLERENFLKQKKIDNLNIVSDGTNLNISKASVKNVLKTNDLALKSPDPKSKFKLMTNRGSFLTRGEKILSKIATMTSTTVENPLANSRGRNMVFARISPSKEAQKNNNITKRKGENLEPKLHKKVKTDSAKTASIFDKLKMSD